MRSLKPSAAPAPSPPAIPREGLPIARRAVTSWALYDLANTIFSMNIVSLYFPLWVTNDLGGADSAYGLASSLSMALMFFSAPLLGALSDQARSRMPFLVTSTVLSVACTAFLGVRTLPVALALFVPANYFFLAGSVFYDSLLPAVSTEANRGRVGGLGVGLGYLGSFIGVGGGMLLVSRLGEEAAKPPIFRLTALAFLVFAIPCFLFVREPRRAVGRFGLTSVRAALQQIGGTARLARRYPGLGRFLVGRVFYTDAANTLIAFMGIYLTREIGFAESQVQLVLMAGITAAVVGGLVWGVVVDRLGPRRTLNMVLALWAFTMSLGVAVPVLGLPRAAFWVVAPLSGIALGGTWAADRPFMLRLSPPRYLGQFYGLYAMAGRFAAIVGPLIWSAVVDWLGFGRPAAVASLVVMVGVAYVILRPVSDAPRAWKPDDQVPVAAP